MSSELPKVAVLLAAYNGMLWIEEQLASILAQTGVSVSIFISVDPSIDGTEAWCAEFSLTHPAITLLPPAGTFGGASRNFFRLIRDVDFQTYDYVAFSDQDDIWHPEKLARAVTKLSPGNIDGYSSNVVAFWSDGRRMLVDKAQTQVEWDYLFEAAGPGCTYVLRQGLASAFKSLISSRWNEVQQIELHDWFCYAFARSRGYNWFIDPIPGMDYRQHERNQIGVNAGITSAIARWRKIADGWWFTQVALTALLLDIKSPVISRTNGVVRISSPMKLACNVSNCRRRARDRWALVIACFVKAITGH